MKPTTDRATLKLTAIMLSALVCVACGSDSDPSVNAAMPDTVVLSEVASGQGCTKYYPGVTVNFAPTEASGALLNEIGGVCTLSNTVLSSAVKNQRSYVKTRYCSLAEGTAAAIARGDMGLALTKLYGLVEEGQFDENESDTLKLALSLCGYETVLDVAVEEFLKSSELNIYSIGSVDHSDSRCPAILWSLSNAEYGQSYNIKGLGNCAGVELPNSDFFNQENNPDGQLRSEYISKVLKYDGVLPSDIDENDGSYTFISSNEKLLDSNAYEQGARARAAHTLLSKNAKSYIHWSLGDENIDTQYLSSSELLVVQYHSDDLQEMPPHERALAALERSFGVPVISEVKQVGLGIQPGVHTSVLTSSGDRFNIVMSTVDGMSEADLIDWLSEADVELLVDHLTDPEKGEYLTLHGASFTNGTATVFGELEECNCSTQGILGWLSQEDLAMAKEHEQARKIFIARARSMAKFRDWKMTSELGPRAISYVTSSYDDSEFNQDAAFVSHDNGAAHTLYVAMDLACNHESLLFTLGDATFSAPAECRNVATGGIGYTLLGDASELITAIQNGSKMKVGLVAPGADTSHEEFQFSLMGATSAMGKLVADEEGFDERAIRHYGGSSLSDETEHGLFEQLRQRPAFCGEGYNPPQCVATGESAPVEATKPVLKAAKPVLRAAKPVARVAKREDYVLGYTKVLAEQIAAGNQPSCIRVAESMMNVARSSLSSEIREQEVDLIISRAPNNCF